NDEAIKRTLLRADCDRRRSDCRLIIRRAMLEQDRRGWRVGRARETRPTIPRSLLRRCRGGSPSGVAARQTGHFAWLFRQAMLPTTRGESPLREGAGLTRGIGRRSVPAA